MCNSVHSKFYLRSVKLNTYSLGSYYKNSIIGARIHILCHALQANVLPMRLDYFKWAVSIFLSFCPLNNVHWSPISIYSRNGNYIIKLLDEKDANIT